MRGQEHLRLAYDSDDDLFREEAMRYQIEGKSRGGDVLRIAPTWTRWFYWLLVAIFAGALLYITLGTVSEYAEGPAVVRVDGRVELTARQPGIVNDVAVRPNQSVVSGQLLVGFYDAQESAELERAREDYKLRLVDWLRRPTDRSAREALASLRARIDQAESRLEERSLRAPHDGVVSDIRVRPGQQVAPGETVLSLVKGEGSSVSIVAMLPGHFRPLLKPGLSMKLELSGYPNTYRELTIDFIDDDVIGPTAVRRFLGGAIADTVALPGPVILVRAHLPESTFEADGQTYSFHDGMQGRAQARIREERILFAFVPGLKTAFGDHGQ